MKVFFEKNKKDLIWFIGVFSIMLVLRVFLFAPVTVSGESMMPTLVDKEKIITSKISKLERLDIVPFKAPNEPGKLYIKRIIGLPGESIEYKDDTLYINNKAYKEPYLDEYKELVSGSLTEDFSLNSLYNVPVVPKDSYFVMGDNRQNSTDSRMIGFIKKEDIIGSSKLVIWPINKIGFFD
ncbi:signal peptidase I [Vagococcus carniphilus]|uniref:signal peptidase I n=1 Tax=Vagococcus carniphilus TaxID=218144 RepID=UPI003BA8444B